MKRSKLLTVVVLGLLLRPALAQPGLSETARQRVRQNFENVALDTLNHTVYYEQRLYRNPFIGLAEMRQVLDDRRIKAFVPMIQGVPVGRYMLNSSLDMEPLSEDERKSYYQQSPFRWQNYKFDFWIQPVFAAIFGNRERPVQSNTSVLLQTQLYLFRGLVFNGGILFPITNHLDGRPQIIRPAPLFLNYFRAIGQSQFLSATAGTFYNDRYGINLQYRHMDLSSPWSFGLEAGLTGFYYYPRGGIYYTNLNELLLQADVAYRLPVPDLTLKLSGGQYLHNDRGVRFDFIRQFTNVEVGLYAMKTRNGATAGFNFAIPIPPGKILQGERARLRTGEEFRWEYTYSRGFSIGERYRVGYQLDQRLRQYHQNYLNRQYLQLR
ncbi:hypothetical protein GCM10027275_46410 [Rhabdobacter roseus]|uniref:Exopolysaccharide biosynthesis protein YbjH n=1 Tax=Rhabdobacter roseus TaxID=1655419 RepID=A0A840U4C8_9BACT|nr:YjbH domain-containing protein [Rhabdobacter roseus]MBB5286689.1 hypothetical protein [Rhabdobacter roseus]